MEGCHRRLAPLIWWGRLRGTLRYRRMGLCVTWCGLIRRTSRLGSKTRGERGGYLELKWYRSSWKITQFPSLFEHINWWRRDIKNTLMAHFLLFGLRPIIVIGWTILLPFWKSTICLRQNLLYMRPQLKVKNQNTIPIWFHTSCDLFWRGKWDGTFLMGKSSFCQITWDNFRIQWSLLSYIEKLSLNKITIPELMALFFFIRIILVS